MQHDETGMGAMGNAIQGTGLGFVVLMAMQNQAMQNQAMCCRGLVPDFESVFMTLGMCKTRSNAAIYV